MCCSPWQQSTNSIFNISPAPEHTKAALCFQKHSRLPWWLTKDPQALFPTNLVLRAAHSAELLKYAAASRFKNLKCTLVSLVGSALFSLAAFRPPSNFAVVLIWPTLKSSPSRSAQCDAVKSRRPWRSEHTRSLFCLHFPRTCKVNLALHRFWILRNSSFDVNETL